MNIELFEIIAAAVIIFLDGMLQTVVGFGYALFCHAAAGMDRFA